MELNAFFPYRLAIAAEGFSRNLSEVYGTQFGLSREEWRLLFLLAEAGKLDSHDLGQRTTLDKVQVCRASQRLEDKKLIERTISERDRRLRDFCITASGRDLFDQVKPQVDQRASDMLNAISDEDRAALFQGIEALIEATRKRNDQDEN